MMTRRSFHLRLSHLASGGRQPPAALARRTRRTSFTLVEMLTVVMIISILASTVLFALFKATQEAKIARTKAQVQRLHQLLLTRWESYRTRPVRIAIPVGTTSRNAARMRLDALRDLMRMELPDCVSDVTDIPVTIWTPPLTSIARPALSREYQRRATAAIPGWTGSSGLASAECLYMIIASIRENGTSGLDFLQTGEIGDTDGNGMPEILDAWGNPIFFVRWPAGFVAHPGLDYITGTADDIPAYSNLQVADPIGSPDPFDPLRVDPRNTIPPTTVAMNSSVGGSETYKFNFALYPLICSAGPDGLYDIVLFDYAPAAPDVPLPYSYYRGSLNPLQPQNDPYGIFPPLPAHSGKRLGEPFLKSKGFTDNITNHFFEVK
jgi:hypothetical protein